MRGRQTMTAQHAAFDRRQLLGASAAALLAMNAGARAEDAKAPAAEQAKKLSELIADFIVGFDLKTAPPLAVERARLAFTDTLGVMLAGSQEHVAKIACEMIQAERSAPAAGVVGQPFRASPQLAAL